MQKDLTLIAEGGKDADLKNLIGQEIKFPADLSHAQLDSLLSRALEKALEETGESGPALILPPDITRYHSGAGYISGIVFRELNRRGSGSMLMPALGTHMAMTAPEISRMFSGIPKERFLVHDWRRDVVELDRIEDGWVEETFKGAVRFDWPVQVNRQLCSGAYKLIVSIGQVVPHEVAGMANHAKNIFVGCGGKEAIDKSHFAGACYGMEKIMGRSDTPVRALFNEGLRRSAEKLPPVLWILTVAGLRPDKTPALRGLFAGFGRECFEKAAALSGELNVELLDKPVQKALVYLEPAEFRTTWLGNKAIYRTRMAMADGGELVILAPALERFGEDRDVDVLIRHYGYRPAAHIRELVEKESLLGENLSAAAHLIHGSSEGRFTVRYCPGPLMSRREIESAGYEWGNLEEALKLYDVKNLPIGWNTLPGGEKIFFVPNPALGLWSHSRNFSG
jgi:nickel-dependent lactate racemase